ncbi:MAG TPA: SRPBCC family protein [Gemmatimonadales bacterium]|nr:SRPBCC family protein [Gemmatimonadales bacterium]
MKNETKMERKSDRELVVTRSFNAPARLVYKAWTTPDLFKQWWVPKSFPITLLSCEKDVRVGGKYKLVFAHGEGQTMAFFGKYLEVVPNAKIVWTNEEDGSGGNVTTVTFEEKDGKTLVVMSDLYASKEALDESLESGSSSSGAATETFQQLEDLLGTLNK